MSTIGTWVRIAPVLCLVACARNAVEAGADEADLAMNGTATSATGATAMGATEAAASNGGQMLDDTGGANANAGAGSGASNVPSAGSPNDASFDADAGASGGTTTGGSGLFGGTGGLFGGASGTSSDSGSDGVETEPAELHVIISELMPRPNGTDATREWIELYNPTDASVALEGCTISREYGDPLSIDAALDLAPSAFVVLGGSEMETLDGVAPDFVLADSSMSLSDTISLHCDAKLVDRVVYVSDDTAPEAATQLDGRRLALGDNDDMATWCLATTALPMGDNLGTPKAANLDCAGVAAP